MYQFVRELLMGIPFLPMVTAFAVNMQAAYIGE
jgi:hypothetical protein